MMVCEITEEEKIRLNCDHLCIFMVEKSEKAIFVYKIFIVAASKFELV